MKVTLTMTRYIAHPYWPERDACINIEKKSGVNRQKSDEKRVAALKAECEKQGITYDQYLEMKKMAERQWYTNDEGWIIIPRHQVCGAIVQCIGSSPKALRGPFTKDNFRALVQVSDFVTDRKESDGVFGRFVKLDASNQRSWQENDYIGEYLEKGQPFTAVGTIVPDDPKLEKTVKALVTEAVTNIGIGAARKMGFGRGTVTFED